VSEGWVDIVVPTNRLSRFLPAALDSVREQRYRRWRLVLVDDGSDAADELDRLAAGLQSATVIHRAHAGVSAARNAAIRAGTSEFVAFLDDDDLWPPERLGELVETLDAHPDAGGVYGNGRYIDADGVVFGQWTTKPASREEFLSRATPIPRITTMLVRRTALERVGLFDERLAYSEDDDLILRLLRHAPLVSSKTVVVDYRRHDHNVTLAEWRTRYRSARTAVTANLDSARRLGEADHVRMLRRHLRHLDRSTAGSSTGRVIGELKARRYREAALDVRDSLGIAPWGFVRGAARTLASKVGSRLRRQAG
jgi:glycosyltransferase involved in cell wall biosynthesis